MSRLPQLPALVSPLFDMPDGIGWREEEPFAWDDKTPPILAGELTHYSVKSGACPDGDGLVFMGCWTTAKIRDPYGVIHFVR